MFQTVALACRWLCCGLQLGQGEAGLGAAGSGSVVWLEHPAVVPQPQLAFAASVELSFAAAVAEPRSAPVFLFLLAILWDTCGFAYWKAPQSLGAGLGCGVAAKVWFGSELFILGWSW